MAGDFNTDTDEIDIGTWGPGTVQQFTMGLWVFVDAFDHASDARFLSKADGTAESDHEWMMGQVSSSGQKWRVRFRAGSATDTFIGSTTMNAGEWYFAVCDYDGTDVTLLVNDVAEAGDFSTSHSVGGNMSSGADPIYIGNQEGADKAPNAAITQVFVLTQLLTANQKTLLYDGFNIDQIGVDPSNVEAWYKMDLESDLGFDSSSNARHGTVSSVGWRFDPLLVKPIETKFRIGASVAGAPDPGRIMSSLVYQGGLAGSGGIAGVGGGLAG